MTDCPWDRMAGIIGARVRELRRERGLSQRALCEAMGRVPGCSAIGRPNLARLEAGGPMPGLRTLVSLARGLGVSVATLIAGADEHI